MAKALHKPGERIGERWADYQGAGKERAGKLDWRKRMSDHVAYALLAYTGLQIFITITVLKSQSHSIMPYFALVVLVVAMIPACRVFEARWSELSDAQAANPELADRFVRDRRAIWLAAIGLPFALTGLFKGVSALFG